MSDMGLHEVSRFEPMDAQIAGTDTPGKIGLAVFGLGVGILTGALASSTSRKRSR